MEDELYRLLNTTLSHLRDDLDMPVTFQPIGTRLYLEDQPSFREQTERSHLDGGDLRLDFQLKLYEFTDARVRA